MTGIMISEMAGDHPLSEESVQALLERALAARADYFDERHDSAFRLLNGFLEGIPDLVVDLYARTIVLLNYAEDVHQTAPLVEMVLHWLRQRLPWLEAGLVKTRLAPDEPGTQGAPSRRGVLAFGEAPARKVREHGVWYALDLTLNLDSSLYLDTRNLRQWALAHLQGRSVLNTFAYTGSLGVAASAAGARQVIQTDRNRRFLNLAKDSISLNGFPVRRTEFLSGDFWAQMNQFKRAGMLFDCVFVDPPYFSSTERGRVNLVDESHKVINKVRPLVGHNGWLVSINNALFLSGADYLAMLQGLCTDGYLSIETLIPVPADITGFPETRVASLPVDPAPFNYSTKITVLRVTRKDQRTA